VTDVIVNEVIDARMFSLLVRSWLFDRVKPHEDEYLRSKEVVLRTVGTMKGLLKMTGARIHAYEMQTPEHRDEARFGKNVALRCRLLERLPEITALANEVWGNAHARPFKSELRDGLRWALDYIDDHATGVASDETIEQLERLREFCAASPGEYAEDWVKRNPGEIDPGDIERQPA